MPCSNGEESGSGALRTRDAADVALVLLNPPILLLVMWAAKRMTGLSYAYLIYDMYPGFPVALDIIPEDRLLVRGWERVMQMVYRDADRIVILGDAVKRRLASTMGRDSAFSTKKPRGFQTGRLDRLSPHGPHAKTRSPWRRGSRVPLRFSVPATSAAARPDRPPLHRISGSLIQRYEVVDVRNLFFAFF